MTPEAGAPEKMIGIGLGSRRELAQPVHRAGGMRTVKVHNIAHTVQGAASILLIPKVTGPGNFACGGRHD
jgi:hypothetical protein